MARLRLPIVPHLSPEEIARRYRTRRGGVEKTHRQVLRLLTRPGDPPTPAAVAAPVGPTPAWARAVLKRWNAAGLADRRPDRNGGRPKLSDEQRAALFEALRGRPPDGGLRSGPKAAAYARDRWGMAVRPEAGWRWLAGLGFGLRVPRPRNPKAATAEGQRDWKGRPGRPDGRASPRPPRAGRRAAGRGRGTPRAQADRPAGLARDGPQADGGRPHEVPVALRLRLRAPGRRAGPGADPAGGEHRLDGPGAGGVRPLGRPRGPQAPGGAGGQRRLARGRAAGRAAERGAAPAAAVHAGVAAGRAAVAAGSRGGGQCGV